MSNAFNTLEISGVEKLTDDAVAISFDVPENLKSQYAFLPGQYLTLRTTIDGEDVRRSYSICSTPEEGLRVGIKRVEGGRLSTYAQSLAAGDHLEVMKPEGRFTCKPDAENKRDILLIAAGSGITPVLSIASSILEGERDTSVTLVYGNQSTATIMFREAIEDLKDRFMERFHVYHVLSREAQDVEFLHGRITVERIVEMTSRGIVQPGTADEIFLCGPMEMTLSLAEHFKAIGISDKKIHTELFEIPGDDKPAPVSARTVEVAADGVDVEVIIDGLHRKFVLDDASQTVLQAAEKSGLELPFSCAGGMCATCRCKVVEGEGAMDKNFSLDDWELEAGYVLACQLRPASEKLVIDFDAA